MWQQVIHQTFDVRFSYPVHFTEGLFDQENPVFAAQFRSGAESDCVKLVVVLDSGVADCHPGVFKRLQSYVESHLPQVEVITEPVVLPGGEESKNSFEYVTEILDAVQENALDRHSFVVVIGGGAVIDTAGYAAAIAHRGIRLIRIPTTVLAQNDAAVGVKNGVNAYGKKNFLGTFSPPYAVLNDLEFLKTLNVRDWRSGISEAVKVALIKDSEFFEELEANADSLCRREMDPMRSLIVHCARLHLNHIAESGDPFETGSSRPLDFGHWSAHKLEQMTSYELRHGEAVAIGIALDAVYSQLLGMLTESDLNRILDLFVRLGFSLHLPLLDTETGRQELLKGLDEFREHLGGELTIMLLNSIGSGVNVHRVDETVYRKALDILGSRKQESV